MSVLNAVCIASGTESAPACEPADVKHRSRTMTLSPTPLRFLPVRAGPLAQGMTRMTGVQTDKGVVTPLGNSQLTSFVCPAHPVPAKGIQDFGVPEESSFKKKKIAKPVNARDSTEGLAHTWTLQETQWARQPTP